MKKRILALFFLGLGNLYAQTQPAKPPTPFAVSTHPFTFGGRQMIVGQAIGGLEKEYRLLDDGGIFRRMNTSKEFEALGQQNPKNIEIAFKSLQDVKFDTMNFQHPGRTSYFIIYKKGKKEHKVVWGDSKYPAPQGALRVYKAFMGMIPKEMQL
ncbi:hypothetical protein DR864_21845 [Runella rosea]|uniref:Uncharacterized protein n=1 Tax=Runella rosea TaxID=2259595 RepID=A0A344TNI3_9BACT|nr:hypothetical protein [Runella rosea]AXE20204.1 hypothetical protein DR864_21845 [Runella rosea]